MSSDRIFAVLTAAAILCHAVATSCGSGRRLSVIKNGELSAELSIPSDDDYEKFRKEIMDEIRVDSVSSANGEPVIMNAVRDEATGEMVATDVISASRVVARFRNVAERFGRITLEFDITVPEKMIESGWRLRFSPLMRMQEDSVWLDPVFITGQKYRDEQMRGYRRYQAFLDSIISDSTDFIRTDQLEIFLKRHFPETYSMKTDSSFVSDPVAENMFGVTQRDALRHYTRHALVHRNDRKNENRDKMFRKYVKDPLIGGNVRLDTVMTGKDGTLVYRYVQEVIARPGLKRIGMSLYGSLYEDGKQIAGLPVPGELAFYVSSLSSLADRTPRYVMKVLERTVYDNTHALIDFAAGSSEIDTLLAANAEELVRVRKCIEDIVSGGEFGVDSINVSASCSPEGRFQANYDLALSRADALKIYMENVAGGAAAPAFRSSAVPENWELLARIASADTVISRECAVKIAEAAALAASSRGLYDAGGQDAISAGDMLDRAERELASMPDYPYLKEKIYPRLRTVRFDFFLYRKGMQKDTVHTTEIDTVYMAGLQALSEMNYRRAVELLRPYNDYNTALAYLSAGYDHSAIAVAEKVSPATPAVKYIMAVALSRTGNRKKALETCLECIEEDPLIAFRANLDPELSGLISLSGRNTD